MNPLTLVRVGVGAAQFISTRLAGQVALRLFLTPQKIPRPQWEIEVLKQAEEHFTVQDCPVWIFGKEGPLVVCVHGWSGRGSQFGKFIPPLVEKGFRVVIFDGPAHGESQIRRTNVRAFSDWLQLLQRRLGPFHSLVGHSFGASSAVVALSRGIKAERVVLVAMPADLDRMFSHFSKSLRLKESTEASFRRQLAKEVNIDLQEASPVLLAPNMKTPCLILHDPHDREVAFRSAEELLSLWPGSRLVPLSGAGHYRILKFANAIEETVKFLDTPVTKV